MTSILHSESTVIRIYIRKGLHFLSERPITGVPVVSCSQFKEGGPQQPPPPPSKLYRLGNHSVGSIDICKGIHILRYRANQWGVVSKPTSFNSHAARKLQMTSVFEMWIVFKKNIFVDTTNNDPIFKSFSK